MTKVSKRERLRITYAIEDTLDNYCRACPYFNLNTPSRVCVLCPASVQLRKCGDALGYEKVLPIERDKPRDWTDDEEKYLIEAYEYSYSYTKMAADLNRTIPSVNMRLRYLRERGKIVIRSDRK